jgi:peroxiredoxin
MIGRTIEGPRRAVNAAVKLPRREPPAGLRCDARARDEGAGKRGNFSAIRVYCDAMRLVRVNAGLLTPALVGIAVVAVLAARVFFDASRGTTSPVPPVATSTAEPSAGSVSTATAAARPPAPSPGNRGLGVETAVRELDLIQLARRKAADDFTIPLAGGQSFHLAEHRGHAVLMNFWATWCSPCLEEMPAMERLWRQHKDGHLVVLAVSVDTDPKIVTPFISRHGYTFAVGLDATMALAQSYGVRAIPSTFLIDRHGDLLAIALGPRKWDNTAAHSLVEAMVR